jgi:Lon protease-like protein
MRLNPQQRSDLDGLRDADPLLVASYAATVLPLDPADREALLAAPDLDARLEGLLVRMPAEARQLN